MSSKQATHHEDDQGPAIPRAIIHKQVLDAAAAKPDASIEAIADDVSGASAHLVERVLDEYGDPAVSELTEPATDDGREPDDSIDEPSSVSQTPEAGPTDIDIPPASELTEKQADLLTAIDEYPTLSQRDLGEVLGVSGATVSVHANSIPQFEWADREAFAAAFVAAQDQPSPAPAEAGEEPSDCPAEVDTPDEVDGPDLDEGVEATEATGGGSTSVLDDPDLAHRVVHACIASENITEAEELTIIRTVMFGPERDAAAVRSE